MNSEPHTFETDPEQLVSDFLAEFHERGAYARDHITRLAELAAADDEQIAEPATKAFFRSLVERLADSFDPAAVSLYNKAFVQLIQTCLMTKRGRLLDDRLTGFGLITEGHLLARADRLRAHASGQQVPAADRAYAGGTGSDVSRVIVLSRVTLGADVAVTSVMLERFKQIFPKAEIVLVGSRKASELFAGDSRITFREIGYPRGATAIDRLLTWLPLLDCVSELAGSVDECLIVDPDSRLTQLGLLPLIDGDSGDEHNRAIGRQYANGGVRYLFFPSREYGHDSSASLSELTSAWLDEVFGASQAGYPYVSPSRADLDAARSLVKRLMRDARPIVTLNFGVGENPSKRVADEFEGRLVGSLLGDGATIVLDKGAGTSEAQRAESVIAFARQASNKPLQAIEVGEDNLPELLGADRLEAELLVWSGRVGLLAALIGESDLYIGYDSAGQHIAAALAVPCVDVFSGFSSRRMLDRWRPTGKAETRIVVVEQSTGADRTLVETLRNARQLLEQRAR
jgi:ADP-heptose:LPS heptosyltransferase